MLADRLPPRSLFVSTTFPPIRSRECEGEVKASLETCPIDEKSRAQERTVTHTRRTKPYTRKCPQSHGEVPVRRLQAEGARSPKGSRALRIHASFTRLRPGRTMEHENRPGEHRLFHPVSRKGVFPTGGRSESRQRRRSFSTRTPQQITTARLAFDDDRGAANHDGIAAIAAASSRWPQQITTLRGDRFARTDGGLVTQREQRRHEDERGGDAGDLADQRGLAEAANGHVLADEE